LYAHACVRVCLVSVWLILVCVWAGSGCVHVCVLECMCLYGCASISVCLHLCVDVIVLHIDVFVCKLAVIYTRVSPCLTVRLCVVVCVCERCDIRLLCNGDATAMVCIPCKCVIVFVCGAPSVGPS